MSSTTVAAAILAKRIKERRLPNLTPPQTGQNELDRALSQITEHLRLYEGTTGAPKQRFVTIDELEGSGLINTVTRQGFASISKVLGQNAQQVSSDNPVTKITISGGGGGGGFVDLLPLDNTWGGQNYFQSGAIEFQERVAAPSAVAGRGYLWLDDSDPNTLWFTDDDGTDFDLTAGGGASQLTDLSDVTTAAVTDKFALMADGAAYVGRAIVEADISDLGTYLSSVAVSDLDNGIDGELITWDAAGVAATVAVGTAGHVLTSGGLGIAPTFQAAAGGGGDGRGARNLRFAHDSSNTMADPGAGEFRTSSGLVTSASNYAFSDTDADGLSVSNILAELEVGSQFILRNADDNTQFRMITIDSITDNGTWWQLQVNHVDGAGATSMVNGDNYEFEFIRDGKVVAGTSTVDGIRDILTWSSTEKEWQPSGSNFRVALAGANGGRLQLGSTGSISVLNPQIKLKVGSFDTRYSLWIEGSGDTQGFYLVSNMASSPDNIRWGARKSSSNTDLLEFDSDNQLTVLSGAAFMLEEKAAAATDLAGAGQIWVKDDAPNTLWFTDDAGTDVQLGTGGGGGSTTIMKFKTANESVISSTALQDDDDMVDYVLAADTWYEVEGFLKVICVNNGVNLKVAAAVDNTLQKSFVSYLNSNTAGSFATDSGEFVASIVSTIVASQPSGITIRGFVHTHATLETNLDLQWAQENSTAQNMTVEGGSWLSFTPLA